MTTATMTQGVPMAWKGARHCLLVLAAENHVHAQPWNNTEAFHSDDPAQLATWLRAGRGPTCPNDVALVDAVQEAIDNG